mmetsp:Transcript_40532/g.104902  ORF Transcript_40532/g.104902 Transcript_40532/m.104902 type:complete len:564 (+) Transcript_40532:144-1835(+)
MGASTGKGVKAQNSLTQGLDRRVGRLSVQGRYHRQRRIEEDYEIHEKVLGSGYNGVVRMATKREAEKKYHYAIKAFKLSNITTDKRQQLDSEVNVFLGMDHPHVARLFDVYETPEYMHLVMECLEGGELFDRVTEKKRFSEGDAANTSRQMLLAVNYLHSHGIVHRDLKLENFLYDFKNGDHLKLIDFGFSKIWDPNIKMHVSCGTLSYVAPEVLEKNYTQQCDLWSLGVITFILLAGYMPFSGSETVQTRSILAGKYTLKKERWSTISKDATHFIQSLLQVDPEKRLTAESALQHEWIVQRKQHDQVVDQGTIDALREFGNATKFRRCCMEMMAWSLSNEERAQVRQHFIAMDQNAQGTITLHELKRVMVDKFNISDEETKKIFAALSSNSDETIHYSDFLAAMLSTRIALHEDLLRSAFIKFDADNTGYITVQNLREVLGNEYEGEQVETLIHEADLLQDGRISYPEFCAYLRGTPLQEAEVAGTVIIDKQLAAGVGKRKHFWNVMPMVSVGSTDVLGRPPSSNGKRSAKTPSTSASFDAPPPGTMPKEAPQTGTGCCCIN